MTLTSGGNLLVGSSVDSGYKLDVNGISRFTGSSSLSAVFSNSGIDNYNSIELRGGTAGTAVNWQISKDNSTANAFELAPSTTAGGTTYSSPVFKILNSGAATFSSSVTATAFIPSYNTSYYATDGRISNYSASNYLYVNGNAGGGLFLKGEGDGTNNIRIESSTSNLISFQTNGSERMRITSGGNLLVGTTTDSGEKLQVSGSVKSSSSFIVGEMTYNSNQIYRNSANEMYVNYSGTGHTILGNATGNVSINAGTNPGYKLDVGGNARFSNKVNYTPIATPSSPSAGDVYYDSTSNKLRCYNGTSWNDLF
jgi:hypothetical protein